MKKLILCASVLTLAACAQPEESEPEAEEEAVEETAAVAVDGGTLAGAYSTIAADGTVALWTLAEDGTFTLETDGADPATGTYTNTETETGATFCADPEGEDAGEVCYEISTPGEDGTWTATDPEGNVLNVSRSE